jgi:hypothetical protein
MVGKAGELAAQYCYLCGLHGSSGIRDLAIRRIENGECSNIKASYMMIIYKFVDAPCAVSFVID